MGNTLYLPEIRRSLHFRIEKYEGGEYTSLSSNNRDISELKEILKNIGYENSEEEDLEG